MPTNNAMFQFLSKFSFLFRPRPTLEDFSVFRGPVHASLHSKRLPNSTKSTDQTMIDKMTTTKPQRPFDEAEMFKQPSLCCLGASLNERSCEQVREIRRNPPVPAEAETKRKTWIRTETWHYLLAWSIIIRPSHCW